MLGASRIARRAAPWARMLTTTTPVMVGKEFEAAAEAIKKVPEAPSQQTMLKLYGLFKQATKGKNTTPKPGMMEFVAKAKWAEWDSLGDMSPEEAEKEYIRVCVENGARLDGSEPEAAAPAGDGTEYKTLIVDRASNGVVTATLNRPDKYNAISMDMYLELQRVMRETAEDKASRALVLTGSGPWYSSGNDLSNFTENMPAEGPTKMAADAAELLHGFVGSFIDFPLPLVAAVNGPAVGIPVTTLGLCDFVFASHTATFATPFTRLGQSPEACSSMVFPDIMGTLRANELLLEGRKITAAEAKDWGLVNEVFDASAFKGSVAERVDALAGLPPKSMRLSKALVRDRVRDELHRVNRAECDLLRERWVSDECMGAIMDFMSRKKQ